MNATFIADLTSWRSCDCDGPLLAYRDSGSRTATIIDRDRIRICMRRRDDRVESLLEVELDLRSRRNGDRRWCELEIRHRDGWPRTSRSTHARHSRHAARGSIIGTGNATRERKGGVATVND